MRNWAVRWVCAGWIAFASGAASGQTWQLSGYLKAMPSATFSRDLPTSPLSQGYLHARHNFNWRSADRAFQVRLGMRTRVFYGDQVAYTPGFAEGLAADRGIWDGSWNWWESADDKGLGNTLFDRALVTWQHGRWRVDAGRQRIHWGRHTIWNPNDLFNAYNFWDFDYAERPGTDALRIRRVVGGSGMNEVEVAARPGSATQAPLLGGVFRWNRWGVDGQILGAWYERTWAAGGAVSAGWGPLAFKAEGTVFGPGEAWGDSAMATGALGVEATWGAGNFVQFGVLRTPGVANAGGSLTAGVPEAWQLLPFKRSGLLSYQTALFHQRARLGIATLWAPLPSTVLAMPTLTMDVARDVTAGVVVQWVWSEASTASSTSAFLSLQWNFNVRRSNR